MLKALRGEWTEHGRDPQPHDERSADSLLPALLGTGPAEKLAEGFKAALNELGKKHKRSSDH